MADDFSVTVDHANFPRAVIELRELIVSDALETEIQSHIQKHPYLLSQQFPHCHFVAPQVKLGAHYVADFFCLEYPSSGPEWYGIELEPPNIPIVTKKGRRSAKLEHAIQQVRDWRAWITDNLQYARAPRDKNGLGLEWIEGRFAGYIFAGRRSDYCDKANEIRRQIVRDERIVIRSWDGFLETAEQRSKIRPFVQDGRLNVEFDQDAS
jgi:hypothetical protein